MKARQLALVSVVAIISVVLLLFSRSTSGDSLATLYDDEFDTARLNTRWSWIREDASHWSLTAAPGSLRIITQYGDLYQGYNNMRNLLLQAMPDTDFEVTTKLKFNPVAEYHQAGVILYQDDDNYLKLVRAYDRPWGGADVVFALERSGSFDHSFHQAVPNSVENLYLKLSRKGTWYRGYYSTDGAAWVLLGAYSQVSFVSPKFGLMAANGYVTYAPEIFADVDFFRVRLDSLYTISGRVTDASGRGIPGVTVWAGFPRNTTTDANGNYTFTGLPAGTYTIRPDKEGYSFFVPASITVTLPPDPAAQDFIGYPCIAPSGLDVCALQSGDILLTASPNTGPCGNEYRILFNIGGTYFTHTGLYLGQVAAASNGDPNDVRPRIAQAQNPYVDPDEQVHETWLTETPFWSGNCLMDWVVVRPTVSTGVRDGAIQWARAKAEESGVLFDIMAAKWDQKRFYCSKFAWMAYKDGAPGGPDLEADRGIGGGVPGAFFRQYWVTPDDLYYSSPTTQAKKVSLEQQLRRGFFWIWSPAHLTLVDPTGRRTGYDSSTGGAVHDIPESTYVASPDAQVESITAPGVDSRWQIIVTGYATGDYVLESGYANKGTRVKIMAGNTFSGKIETYPVADPEYVQYLPVVWASR